MPRLTVENLTGAADDIVKRLESLGDRLPILTAKVAQYVLREAQRRAPRGTGVLRSIPGLRRSLNVSLVDDDEFALTSPLPYAAVQNFGGTITAGNGRLRSRYLAIPVNDAARRIVVERLVTVYFFDRVRRDGPVRRGRRCGRPPGW